MVGQTNINTCRVSEPNRQNINKIVARLRKYRILIKNILTFLGLDYKIELILKFYLIIWPRNHYSKSDDQDDLSRVKE